MAIALALLVFLQQFLPPPPPPPEGLLAGPPIANAIPQNGEGIVQGVVRRTDTNAPMRDVEIQIYTTGSPTKPASTLTALTSAEGTFEFKNLPFDSYRLAVGRSGFFTASATGLAVTVAQASAVLDASKKAVSITIDLIPGSTIAGTVLDVNGNAAVNTPVSAMRLTYRKGRRALSREKSVLTDDRGMYRLAGLPPGEYFVRAELRAVAPANFNSEEAISLRAFGVRNVGGAPSLGGTVSSYSLAYAPGASDPQSAVTLKVRGGEEQQSDIRFPKTTVVRISGTAVSAVDGAPQRLMGLLLIPRNPAFDEDVASIVLDNVAADKSAGRFEVAVGRPGSYDLVALVSNNVRETLSFGTGVRAGYSTARLPVEVRTEDIRDLRMAVSPSAEIEIRYLAASGSLDLSRGLGFVVRSLDATDSTPLAETGIIVNPDGRVYTTVRFTATAKTSKLPEGQYQFEFPTVPPGTYVSAMRQGGRSILADGVATVGKGQADPIEVTFSSGAGKVSGKIEGAEVTGVRPARVALVPQGARRSAPLFYGRTNSTDGSFTFNNVAPGDYKVYAFEMLPSSADENAEFMAEFESSGRAVSVRESADVTGVTLPLIRASK